MCNWNDSSEALFQWVSAHPHFTWFQVGTLTELFTNQGNKNPDKALSLSHRFWWTERHESHSATGNAWWSSGQIRKNGRKWQTWLSRKYVLKTKWTGWHWNFTVARLWRFQRGFFPCSTLKSKSKSKLLGEEVGLRSYWPPKVPRTCHKQQRVAVFDALEMMVCCSALALVKEALSRVTCHSGSLWSIIRLDSLSFMI